MTDKLPPSRPKVMTRRRFLVATSASAVANYLVLNRPVWAATPDLARAGDFGELDATAGDGIDLYLENRDVLIGGQPGQAITINGSIPGPVIRMTEGKDALIRVHNRLPEATSIHWHGILLPFDMDGVPGISFAGIAAGETFTYRFPCLTHSSGGSMAQATANTVEGLRTRQKEGLRRGHNPSFKNWGGRRGVKCQ